MELVNAVPDVPDVPNHVHVAVPDVLAALGALGGFGALAVAAHVHTQGLVQAAATLPIVFVGTAAMTIPSLMVLVPACDLRLSPEQVVVGVSAGVLRAGRLAAGMSPFLLFFALTTGDAPWFGALLLVAIACDGLAASARNLVLLGGVAARPLVALWVVVAALIGLRLLVSTIGLWGAL